MPPGPHRFRRPFCFFRDRARVQRLHVPRHIQNRGRDRRRSWKPVRIPAPPTSGPAAVPATRPWDFQFRRFIQFTKIRSELPQNKFLRHGKTTIQKNRTEQRLKTCPPMPTDVRVRHWPPRPAQNQMRAKAQSTGVFGQGVAIDKFRPRLRQRALIEGRKLFIEFLRENELQNRVAEKFQPLIMRRG